MEVEEKRYFLGLDGGGTKTHGAIYDRLRGEIFLIVGGPTNHEVLENGLEALPEVLKNLLDRLLCEAGIKMDNLSAAAFGIGGVDTPMQHDIIAGMIKNLGIGSFVLSNDSYLGIKTECSEGYGISAVNGSGYSVTGINHNGEMLQIGGHGQMTGDKGGGCYLVPAAISRVYGELYKQGPRTQMTDRLLELLSIKEKEMLCQAVALRIIKDAPSFYKSVSRILYRSAAEGDKEALSILEESGKDYACTIKCIAQELQIPRPVPVVLVGSQFTRCEFPYAIQVLKRELDHENYQVKTISTLPVAGAIIWALETAGIHVSTEERMEIHKLLNGQCKEGDVHE